VNVVSARTLEEALAAKADHPEALPIAGGTDVMVAINGGAERPETILDLSRVGELDRWERGGELSLGAGVTYSRVLRELDDERALAQAARSVGSPQIRNRGTVGGNLGTASPAGDLLPVVAASDATIELGSDGGGRREVGWEAFFVGPKRTAIEPDELIVGVRWRRPRGPGVFAKVGPRNAMVIAVCSVCLLMDEDERAIRLALGSVGPTVLRARDAEAFATGALEEAGAWGQPARALDDAAVARFAELAAGEARPIDDLRGTGAYRRHAIAVLAGRALRWVLADRAEEAG
jgi:CO/xanthine dehydrogenase FAD-binding subunit